MKKLAYILISAVYLACILIVAGCTKQAPVQNTITNNYTITQTVNNAGDGASITNTTETVSAVELEPPVQTVENTKKDSMYIFWLVILAILSVAGYFVYLRYFKKSSI